MAIHTVPWTLQSASHGAELFRQTTQSLLAGTGVVGSGDLAVTQNGSPNMSVNVAAGQVWIPGTLGGTSAIGLTNLGNQNASYSSLPTGLTTQGSYYSINDATVNLAISASNPTNPRIDLICASVQDAFYSGATNTVVLQVITGTPASSPSPPTPPANSVVIAQIAVAANASSIVTANITDKRPYVGLLGPTVLPQFQVHMAAAQSIANNTQTTIAYDTVDKDNFSGWSAVNHQYTIPTGQAGLWLFGCTMFWASNGTGVRGLTIADGSGIALSSWNWVGASIDPALDGRMWVGAGPTVLAAGNTVKVQAYQNSGGALNTVTGTPNVQFSGVRVG